MLVKQFHTLLGEIPKWRQAKLGIPHKKRRRKREFDNSLPKYVLHYKSGKYEGYEVQCHPILHNKKFTKSKFTMKERLQMAIDYLQGGKK